MYSGRRALRSRLFRGKDLRGRGRRFCACASVPTAGWSGPLVYDYTVTSETGSIKYNDESYTGSYTTENDEIDGLFTVKVGVGNVTIKTFEKTDFPTTVQPNETTEAPAETTGA